MKRHLSVLIPLISLILIGAGRFSSQKSSFLPQSESSVTLVHHSDLELNSEHQAIIQDEHSSPSGHGHSPLELVNEEEELTEKKESNRPALRNYQRLVHLCCSVFVERNIDFVSQYIPHSSNITPYIGVSFARSLGVFLI